MNAHKVIGQRIDQPITDGHESVLGSPYEDDEYINRFEYSLWEIRRGKMNLRCFSICIRFNF